MIETRDWRCENPDCRILLGRWQGKELVLRYKDVQYSVEDGTVRAICRKCARLNITRAKEPDHHAA